MTSIWLSIGLSSSYRIFLWFSYSKKKDLLFFSYAVFILMLYLFMLFQSPFPLGKFWYCNLPYYVTSAKKNTTMKWKTVCECRNKVNMDSGLLLPLFNPLKWSVHVSVCYSVQRLILCFWLKNQCVFPWQKDLGALRLPRESGHCMCCSSSNDTDDWE